MRLRSCLGGGDLRSRDATKKLWFGLSLAPPHLNTPSYIRRKYLANLIHIRRGLTSSPHDKHGTQTPPQKRQLEQSCKKSYCRVPRDLEGYPVLRCTSRAWWFPRLARRPPPAGRTTAPGVRRRRSPFFARTARPRAFPLEPPAIT